MDTCEHEGCDALRGKGKRSPFCDEHKAEHRRLWNRDRMRRKREEEAADKILGLTGVSDGRSIPGQTADAYTPATQHHPASIKARREAQERIEVVDYTQPGATSRHSAFQARTPRPDLQRYRAPSMEEQTWAPDDDAGYYDGIDWRARNDMAQGPYQGGYVPAGNPVAFVVRRVSR